MSFVSCLHQLEDDAGVFPEDEAVLYVHHVGSVGLVLPRQLLQYRDIPLGLLEKPLLVPDDLDGRVLLGLVVIDLEDLAEGALAQAGGI